MFPPSGHNSFMQNTYTVRIDSFCVSCVKRKKCLGTVSFTSFLGVCSECGRQPMEPVQGIKNLYSVGCCFFFSFFTLLYGFILCSFL